MVREGLTALTHPAVWRSAEIPVEAMRKFLTQLEIEQQELEAAWADMQPTVFGRLGAAPPGQ